MPSEVITRPCQASFHGSIMLLLGQGSRMHLRALALASSACSRVLTLAVFGKGNVSLKASHASNPRKTPAEQTPASPPIITRGLPNSRGLEASLVGGTCHVRRGRYPPHPINSPSSMEGLSGINSNKNIASPLHSMPVELISFFLLLRPAPNQHVLSACRRSCRGPRHPFHDCGSGSHGSKH